MYRNTGISDFLKFSRDLPAPSGAWTLDVSIYTGRTAPLQNTPRSKTSGDLNIFKLKHKGRVLSKSWTSRSVKDRLFPRLYIFLLIAICSFDLDVTFGCRVCRPNLQSNPSQECDLLPNLRLGKRM